MLKIASTYEDIQNVLPCCSQKSKGNHHFPAIDIHAVEVKPNQKSFSTVYMKCNNVCFNYVNCVMV